MKTIILTTFPNGDDGIPDTLVIPIDRETVLSWLKTMDEVQGSAGVVSVNLKFTGADIMGDDDFDQFEDAAWPLRGDFRRIADDKREAFVEHTRHSGEHPDSQSYVACVKSGHLRIQGSWDGCELYSDRLTRAMLESLLADLTE